VAGHRRSLRVQSSWCKLHIVVVAPDNSATYAVDWHSDHSQAHTVAATGGGASGQSPWPWPTKWLH